MVHPNSTLLLTISGADTAIQLVFLTLVLIFCHDKKKRLTVLLIIVVELVIVAALATLILTVVHTTQRRSMIVGVIAVFVGIMMYAAPLSVMAAGEIKQDDIGIKTQKQFDQNMSDSHVSRLTNYTRSNPINQKTKEMKTQQKIKMVDLNSRECFFGST
ncbi:Detected protein of confused Function [Hibiscus syriacus]|uniref:Detected protein of confused Function n=1 Tax=Hibiscus syriacus TaxID=106335 RepID=A0A6A3B650_HIBSY|nr:Detected protein of confused Function [Hibiscus syriacus]